jgi:flavodoxin
VRRTGAYKVLEDRMKVLLIYDSVYGNTERIAQAIGNVLGARNEIRVLRVGNVKSSDLANLDLLIVGSPTQQFRATKAIKKFIGGIRKGELNGVQVTAFDTRLGIDEMPSRILPPFVRIFGYAAKPIADSLKSKGGKLIAPPEGFLVKGMEGPLKDGELERAALWAEKLANRQ